MNVMFCKRCGVGKISKHYRVGHGSVPCRPLFSLSLLILVKISFSDGFRKVLDGVRMESDWSQHSYIIQIPTSSLLVTFSEDSTLNLKGPGG